jgi:hypothetical protein
MEVKTRLMKCLRMRVMVMIPRHVRPNARYGFASWLIRRSIHFTYDLDLSFRFCGLFFTCEKYLEGHIAAKVCCGNLAHKHSAHCERTCPICQRKFTFQEILDGTFTTHCEVPALLRQTQKKLAQVVVRAAFPILLRTSLRWVLRSMVPMLKVWHLPMVYLQTVSVVTVVSSFPP